MGADLPWHQWKKHSPDYLKCIFISMLWNKYASSITVMFYFKKNTSLGQHCGLVE